MNTGDKNTKGRVILRGPKGGLYVLGPTGTKLRTFIKAAAPAVVAAAPRTDRVMNTITHKGAKFIRMGNASVHGDPVYKKVGFSTYYAIGTSGPKHIVSGTMINKINGTSVTFKNYKKSKESAAAAAPAAAVRIATPPMTAALRSAIAHITKLKTAAGRARHVAKLRGVLSAANFAALERRARNLGVTVPAAPPAAPVPSPGASSASPRITTAERNVRLAAIRARLNAMRAAKLAAMPMRRANVNKRLKNVAARVRERLRPKNRPTSSTVSVPFCHAPASVPRKACSVRYVDLRVYNSPLIDDGTMLATRASDIDLDWFKRQDKYVKSLNDYDFWTAQAHTNRSHSWIGPYLYRGSVSHHLPSGGPHIAPLWPQIRKMILDGSYIDRSNIWVDRFKAASGESERYDIYKRRIQDDIPHSVMERALTMYKDDLKRIIAGAPKSRKKMILYRGSTFDIFRSTLGHWHTLGSFCSASYDLGHALGYEGGTMQRITVLPGTPVLLVAGMNQWNFNGEYEIMVNLGTKYLIRGRGVKRVVWTGPYGKRTTRVTDVTIAK